MTSVTLHEGDNRKSLRRLIDQGVRVHSVVTDPPYGLTSITKRFGKDGAAPAKFGSDGAFSRASAGFMGSKWDGTGIERDPEFWRLIYDILLPGGYVVAFSGSRTGHWQACAMEMAGFIMHPFLGWVYGQGFPKAHNAAMAIDKALGVPQGFVPEGGSVKRMIPGADQHATGDWIKTEEREYQPGRRVPGSPEAAQWDGWAYGGQALKPALEPIFVGQKPFSEKNGALNLLKHGVGAINIDGCRAEGGQWQWTSPRGDALKFGGDEARMSGADEIGVEGVNSKGRHPANLLHDGSAEVIALFPAQAGAASPVKGTEPSGVTDAIYGKFNGRVPGQFHGDSGSAARFFNSFGYSDVEEVMRVTGCADEEGRNIVAYLERHLSLSPDAPTFYQGKATKADRAGSKHPTVKPIALMQWLCRLVTPPGGTVLDPFAGSGTTGAAARAEGFDCMLMEAEGQFIADIRRRFNLVVPANDCSLFDDILGGDPVPELEAILG